MRSWSGFSLLLSPFWRALNKRGIDSPGGHSCKFMARLAENQFAESQICNSAGPCSRRWNYIFQKFIRNRGRQQQKICYFFFWKLTPPPIFGFWNLCLPRQYEEAKDSELLCCCHQFLICPGPFSQRNNARVKPRKSRPLKGVRDSNSLRVVKLLCVVNVLHICSECSMAGSFE